MKPKFSICIASHNMSHLLPEAIESALQQDYPNKEIIVLDDASTDGTSDSVFKHWPQVKIFQSKEPSGTGGAFNKAILHSTGDYVILLCADDYFTDHRLLSDIAEIFNDKKVGHVSRYYYQFMHEDKFRRPVRAWQKKSLIELANNPSGLAFRREALKCFRPLLGARYEPNPPMYEGTRELSNRMFVEASTLVQSVFDAGWTCVTLPWDTVAVRIHQSISRNKEYYRKRWVSSPIEEWVKVGGKELLNDWTSLIQIKNFFEFKGLLSEISNFMRLKPILCINPLWWLFVCGVVLTPRAITMKAPDIYRRTVGPLLTKSIIRPES
jgi:glycosyltransferase involved in cell wall biosynthesis